MTANTRLPIASDDEYVVVKDGHITLAGKRVRYWGAIGTFPATSYEANSAAVTRIKALGFNMIRHWQSPQPYTLGDKSPGDLNDHFLLCCKEAGLKIWYAGLNRVGVLDPSLVSLVDEPETAQQWHDAIATMSNKSVRDNAARYWDSRISAVAITRMKEILEHVNAHTGFRYADDPLFAVWELTNEEWWFHRVKRGDFGHLPPFIMSSFFGLWNNFLLTKYGSHEAMAAAWIGNLLPEESLNKKNIFLLPLLGDIRDDQASALGVGYAAVGQKQVYEKSLFNERRGADVIEFLLSIWINGKQKEADVVKSMGESTRKCPLVWDTGIGYDMQTQFMQQHADAISHDSYFNAPFQLDPHHKRFPWMSQLEELPKVCWDKPWLEQNRFEGKPFFVYETQIMQPAKYRAEYPMLIARIGALQDWDIVCWHYWGHPLDITQTTHYDAPMDYVSKNHYPLGYHYQFDEVQQASMTMAGEIFKNGLLAPAATPTHIIFGKKSLHSWSMNEYGEIGQTFLPTTYRHGVRLLIDPSRPDDEIKGPHYHGRGIYEPCPIVATPEIIHDWQKGYLIFDSPSTVMFTGFFANLGDSLEFQNGTKLSHVAIHNPETMCYPVTEDEKFISFCAASQDGLPLATSKKICLALVSTSFNEGFAIDENKHGTRPFHPVAEWYWDMDSLALSSMGKPLVARVKATLTGSWLAGMKYQLLDFQMKSIRKGTCGSGTLRIPNDVPVFLIYLTR